MSSFSLRRLVQISLLCLMGACTVSCGTTSSEPKKRKPVPPSDTANASSLPWNRPRGFESSSGMGRMMPQSR